MTDECSGDMLERGDGPEERRRGVRVAFETRVRLEVGGEEIRTEGSSRDLSQKGIFIAGEKGVSIGEDCRVEVELSGMVDPVKLLMKGRIARVTNEGIGIEFIEMDLDTFTHLKNVVRYNCEDPDEI